MNSTLESLPRSLPPEVVCDRCTDSQASLLLDVRTAAEFEEIHVEGARHLALHELDPDKVRGAIGSGRAIYLLCGSGKRAEQARQTLDAAGVDACVIEGGIQAWKDAGLPVKEGRQTLSLERQVRIAAGLLILLGVTLGFLVHPGFFGLAAFVGAGLTFAGITDTCGMGLMLARMPWNQTGSKAHAL